MTFIQDEALCDMAWGRKRKTPSRLSGLSRMGGVFNRHGDFYIVQLLQINRHFLELLALWMAKHFGIDRDVDFNQLLEVHVKLCDLELHGFDVARTVRSVQHNLGGHPVISQRFRSLQEREKQDDEEEGGRERGKGKFLAKLTETRNYVRS